LHEVAIVDRVQVDVEGIPENSHHVAIPAVEPLEVVIYSKKASRRRSMPVYGFTAAGQPLVVDPQGARLVSAAGVVKAGETMWIQAREEKPEAAVGPFTPAPAGMTAVYEDGRRLPIVYYDVHGRPVSIFAGDKSHVLFVVDEDDDGLIGIEGGPHVTAAPVSPSTD
jgi:hypothetical protein